MSNELFDICDNLSQDLIENQPYTIMMKILKINKIDIKYLYVIEKCLMCLLRRESHKSFTACIGGELNKYILFELLNYYVKYDIEIGIINSIILCNGLINRYYTEIIKIALLKYENNKFKECEYMKENLFERHDTDEIDLKIYLSLYKLRNDKILSLYDSKNDEFVSGTFSELLDFKIYKNKKSEWISNTELQFR